MTYSSFVSGSSESAIFTRIRKDLETYDVVLYMKGTPERPLCGFSAVVVQILKAYGVDFKGFNVLEDEALRQGIKDFTDWPTIPQLYVKGEFVGGCDIIRDMHQTNELAGFFKEKGILFQVPSLGQ